MHHLVAATPQSCGSQLLDNAAYHVHVVVQVDHPAFGLCMDPGNIIYFTAPSNQPSVQDAQHRLPTEGLEAVAHRFNTMVIKVSNIPVHETTCRPRSSARCGIMDQTLATSNSKTILLNLNNQDCVIGPTPGEAEHPERSSNPPGSNRHCHDCHSNGTLIGLPFAPCVVWNAGHVICPIYFSNYYLLRMEEVTALAMARHSRRDHQPRRGPRGLPCRAASQCQHCTLTSHEKRCSRNV